MMNIDKTTLAVSILSIVLSSIALTTVVNKNADISTLNEKVAKLQDTQIQGSSKPDTGDLESYLMDNPEVIVKSLAKYRFTQEQQAKSQEKEQLNTMTDALYNDKNDPFIGNPNGKNVLVEFIDYNCGYCKRLAPTLERWLEIDPEAKIIVKEYPIFTNQPTSAYSALMASALFYYDKDKYHEFHVALMNERSITKEFIEEKLAELGVTKDNLTPFLDKAKSQVEITRGLGAQLNITGTPTVFHNGERSHGGFTPEQLKSAL